MGTLRCTNPKNLPLIDDKEESAVDERSKQSKTWCYIFLYNYLLIFVL